MVDVLSRLDPSAIGRWRAQGGAQGAQGGIDLAGHICDQVRNLSQRLQAPDGAPVGEHADVVGEPGRGSGVPRAGLDHGPAEQLLRRYVAPRTADAVIGCVAWPGLAKQVLAWQDQGIPIAAELAHLPEERIRHANFPAGYLKAVLRRSVDVRQNVDARQDTAGQDTAGQDTAGQDTAGQNTVGETAAAEAARSGDRGGVDGLGETRRPGPVTDAGRDGVPESPFPIRDLDPTHAVEHAALEMSRGAGTVADDAYIEAVLTADDPGRTGLDLDGGPSQSESEVSTAQDERAVDPEVSQDPVSCAELERVVAQAEQESAPTAGALRAECAHRPPDATTQQPPPAAQPPAPPEPGPAPVRSPTRAPRRR